MEQKNLKPCPFCGQKAEFNETSRFYIGCTNPNCQGFFATIDGIRYQFYNDAIESWNKRAILLNITSAEVLNHIMPCPFCGQSAAILKQSKNFLMYNDFYVISCANSMCRGFYINKMSFHECSNEQKAIDKWNKRF